MFNDAGFNEFASLIGDTTRAVMIAANGQCNLWALLIVRLEVRWAG